MPLNHSFCLFGFLPFQPFGRWALTLPFGIVCDMVFAFSGWMSPAKNLVGKTYLRLKLRWLQITGLMTVLALVGLWLLLALPLSFRGIELDWLGKAMLGFRYLPFRIQWWFA